MATTNQRTAMVQIPAGVLAHLCTAADSGAFDETQLWGFTRVALQPYWITTQANGAGGNAAQSNKPKAAPRQASNARNTEMETKQRTRTRNARSGSRREQLISLIRSKPEGMTRGQILDELGLKDDKSGAMSVSNALTALTKNGTFLRSANRGYCPGPNIGAVTQEAQQLADA